MSSGGRHDLIGRIIGMLVFIGGVILLYLVFHTAYELFNASPEGALNLKFTGDPKKDPQLGAIGTHFGYLLFRVAYLFIMALTGSLISQKGINLYFSALKGHPVQVMSIAHPDPT